MDETTLYEKILGISPPWYVSGIAFDEANQTVLVTVEVDPDTPLLCPQCGQASPRYDKRHRRWRHLDTCQFKTQVEADVPRVQCKTHGCQTIDVPWAQGNARYTLLFEAMVILFLKETSIAAVSRLLKLSWNAVDGIMQRAVQRGLARQAVTAPVHLSVDEVAFRKRHEYVTVVSDEHGDVIHLGDERSAQSLAGYYQTLTDAQKHGICSVSMDMWPAYISATLEHVPQAQDKIAFDKFHVNQHLNQAVDAVRKQEHRQMLKQGESILKGTKYDWLRNALDMDPTLRDELEHKCRIAKQTGRAWSIKEYTKGLWDYVTRGWAKHAWLRWYQWAIRSRLAPIKKVARMIKRHLYGIVNAIVLDVDNSRAESINSKIKMVKARARGFRNRDRFKTAILFYCGGLSLLPENT